MSAAGTGKRLVILSPAPQRVARIFTEAALQRLHDRYTVVDLEDDPSEVTLEAALPDVFAIIGQPDLPRSRLARATQLRAVLNVEGNFFPNIDYATCFANGIHVLGCGPAYAGGIPQAFFQIGDMVLDDLDLIERGLPPARMQVAARELVGRYRNHPVA